MSDEERAWLTEEPSPSASGGPSRFQEVGLVDDPAPRPPLQLEPVRPPAQRPRWLALAAVAVAVVLVVSVGGAWALATLLNNTSADAVRTGYSYIPKSATVAIELRLDLPAGQKEQLGSFLSRFPGFGEASTVEQRLVDALDELVASFSQGKATYSQDVQSFFSGWVVGAMPVRPARTGAAGPTLVFGVSDRGAAETAMLKLRSSTLEWTAQDVGGVQLWSGGFARNDLDLGFGTQAYAVTDDALIYASTADDVRAALDVHADVNASLLGNQRFADALRRVPPGRLGLVWVDIEGSGAFTMLGGSMAMGGPACAALITTLPKDALAVLYLRDGRAILDATYSHSAGSPRVALRGSVIDLHVPPDTFVYAEAKRAEGTSIDSVLACLRSYAQLGNELDELETELGNLEDLLDWVGDAGLAVRFDGTKLTAGVVIQATDELKASETLGQLRAAVTSMDSDSWHVSVSEETYRDTRLVTFTVEPDEGHEWQRPLPEPALAYAMKDGLVVIGIDASFVRAVLDTEAANSLANKASYRRALDFAGGAQNGGVLFIDVPAALAVRQAAGQQFGTDLLGVGLEGYFTVLDDVSAVLLGDDATTTIRVTVNTRLPGQSAP